MSKVESENLSPILASQPQDRDSSYNLEMGQLLFANGQFKKSLAYIKEAMSSFLAEKDFSSYFSSCSLLLQALNELGEIEEAKQLQQNIERTLQAHKMAPPPYIMAWSAYYSIHNEKNFEKAKTRLNTALKMAFDRHDRCIKAGDRLKQNDMRFQIINCLYVYSIYYLETGDYENCLQELKNLKILLADYLQLKKEVEWDHSRTDNTQELQNYHQILQELTKSEPKAQKIQLGLKFMELLVEIKHRKQYTQAERGLWDLYETANKTNNTYYIPYILCSMAWCHIKLNNKKQAHLLFNLAEKNVNKERKPLALYMESLKQQEFAVLEKKTDNYDLVFNFQDYTIVEKHKGCIDLKNQFILIDLLKLLALNPGMSYSKEQIVQKVWKQDYFPEIHDNKIYVTIKRLREMIEVNSCKPRYICRSHAGYHFSKRANILIQPAERQ